ncbi:hypothetical protein ACI65C_005217 [Semiaphis heraclei]
MDNNASNTNNTTKKLNKKKMSKKNVLNRNIITKPNKRLTPTKTKYKYHISARFYKKLQQLERMNRKLCLKIRYLATYKNEFQNIKIKYLRLKEKVVDTEIKLLLDGIPTSDYPLFNIDYNEKSPKNDDDNSKFPITQLEILSDHHNNIENQ